MGSATLGWDETELPQLAVMWAERSGSAEPKRATS